MNLSAEAVDRIMKDSLFKEGEITGGQPPADAVVVEGLVSKFGFHPARLASHKAEIDAMLADLSSDFHLSVGGGASFLNGCMDKDGNQWGEQRDVQSLVCLGIGVGSASWLLKEMASVMPGGVPYFEVHPETKAEAA